MKIYSKNENRSSTYSTSFGGTAFLLPRALVESTGVVSIGRGLEVDMHEGPSGVCTSSDRGELEESSSE